jgi:hypothetical protein
MSGSLLLTVRSEVRQVFTLRPVPSRDWSISAVIFTKQRAIHIPNVRSEKYRVRESCGLNRNDKLMENEP